MVWRKCGESVGDIVEIVVGACVEMLWRDCAEIVCVEIAEKGVMECRDSGGRLWVECG